MFSLPTTAGSGSHVAAEHGFYHELVEAVGDWVMVCPKVGLGNLFYAATGVHSQNRIWRNRIDRKHVDFLLCQPGTMRPLLGVELDDRSHKRRDRQQRDRFVDQVFKVAGMRLIHVPVQRTDDVNRLAAFVRDRVKATALVL